MTAQHGIIKVNVRWIFDLGNPCLTKNNVLRLLHKAMANSETLK